MRSERQFCERLHCDLLFKRLLGHAVAREFFSAILEEARRRRLLSEEHFTVGGTLLGRRCTGLSAE